MSVMARGYRGALQGPGRRSATISRVVLVARAQPLVKPFLYGEDTERGDLRD
jgi:hypothetical protein